MTVARAVLFDLDDTLFDHAHCARSALTAVRASHSPFSEIAIDELERSHSLILEQLHGDVATGRVPLDVARAERFRRLFRVAGFEANDDRAAAAAASYRHAYLDARRAIDGAAAVLEAVHRRARIGIVTNNLVAEQQEKLRHCGLDRHVDLLMASEVAGVSKPHPEIFRLALAQLDCAPEQAVMVGDSWSNDIAGAQAAGIRAIWFNPAGETPQAPGVPVLRAWLPVQQALRTILGI